MLEFLNVLQSLLQLRLTCLQVVMIFLQLLRVFVAFVFSLLRRKPRLLQLIPQLRHLCAKSCLVLLVGLDLSTQSVAFASVLVERGLKLPTTLNAKEHFATPSFKPLVHRVRQLHGIDAVHGPLLPRLMMLRMLMMALRAAVAAVAA